MLIKCIMVGLGGFVGSIFRYLIGTIPFLNKWELPVHTLLINLLGAVLIGLIVKLSETYGGFSENTMLLLKVGICGGFTTFSAFSLETLSLIEEGKMAIAGIYILMSVLLCIVGIYVGKSLIMIEN